MARMSDADKLTAEWVARQVRDYGPVTREHAASMAEAARQRGGKANEMLAYGLGQIAGEMEPGEVISGSVPWWKRL